MAAKFELDPHSPMPLYYQVYTSMMERISSTEFKPQQLLPSERELIDQYGVSRITVSKAMDLLKEQGAISLRPGKGHVVNRKKIHNDPTSRASITDHMRQQGVDIQWQVLSRQWTQGSDVAAVGLPLVTNRKYYQVQLLLLSANKPIGFHYVYVPIKLASEADLENMQDQKLLVFLRESPIAKNCRLERCLEALLAEGEVSELLQLKHGAAMMRVDIAYISHSDKLIQAMRSYYCGESFRYKF